MSRNYFYVFLLFFINCSDIQETPKYPIAVEIITITSDQSKENGLRNKYNVKIKNSNLDYIIVKKCQLDSSAPFFINFYVLQCFTGTMNAIETYKGPTPISERVLYTGYDTIYRNNEKKFLLDPLLSSYLSDSTDFALLEFPIKSPYFDSLNLTKPYSYKLSLNPKLNHPFFIYSIDDAFNFTDTTQVFLQEHPSIINKKF